MIGSNEPPSGGGWPSSDGRGDGEGAHPSEATLHDHVDGLLPPEVRRRVEAHTAECLACRRHLEALRSLTVDLASLPRQIAPARELLPGIAARIGRDPGPRAPRPSGALWPHRYRLAAAAVALVLLSSLVTATLVGRKGPASAGGGSEVATGSPAVATGSPGAAVGPPTVDFRAVEAAYLSAIGEVVEGVELRREELSPATIRILEESLAIIDRALREAREAIEADPGNPVLREILVATYEQKLDLLRRAAGDAARG